MSDSDPLYTVFIRLPFPRGDFVDPPFVEWDAGKDKALWKILSKASKNSDIDWNELATKFDVSLTFLLQQAAWLYERQLLQVRAQMRKVGASKGSAAPSPIPGSTSENVGGEMMRTTSSGGAGPRVSSALSARKDSPFPKGDAPTPSALGRTIAPPISRTSSANTTITARNFNQISSHPAPTRPSLSPNPKSRPSSIAVDPRASSQSPVPEDSLTSPSASSSDSSSDSSPPAQSRLLRRPPRFTSKKLEQSDDDDDDDGPAFMPVAGVSQAAHHDLSDTLRGDAQNISRRTPSHGHHKKPADASSITQRSQTSDSSASSTAHRRPEPLTRGGSGRQRLTGPLSPRRTVALKAREGSDGTPSMGSSFSDLDDASVTQSALEEALASNMQAGGGMASRMSSISQALRSKYL
ncbi:Uncharacterized protein BP5553_06821 [Venustampulla echinocandica]|uniref:Autophagy-related protein 29 n=1 Tax=Venustampulla echinocandica TaxID=2656787 RepID=A0A370TL07_9HELO|nr:Uncharacterized protein BP5553_06821 [Venustampulla echinocandica]RDL36209.1 Uncharacterized protein BP5553_06821 [Venustampulla echinocandica]